jgi:hypothetical protein
VKKLTGGFDNGLGATLIGEHSLTSFLFEEIGRRHFATFSTASVLSAAELRRRRPQVRPKKPAAVAGDRGFGLRLTTAPYLSRANCAAYHLPFPVRVRMQRLLRFFAIG